MQNIQDLKTLGKKKTQKEDTFTEISSLIFWLLEGTSEVSIFYECLQEVIAQPLEHRAGKMHTPVSMMIAITLLENSPGSAQLDDENCISQLPPQRLFFF